MNIGAAIMTILLTGILTDNFVLSKFLGICPFLGVSKTTSGATGMGAAVTAVMVLATAVTWPLYTFFLVPMGLTYLNTILFILIIALLVQLVEMVLRKYVPALYNTLGVYLPLITTNCAVLGVTTLNIDNGYNFGESLVNALGAGIGFLVAMIIFSNVRGRLERCNVPKTFDGMPITLIAASIVSLSFVGFGGLAEGLFGGA